MTAHHDLAHSYADDLDAATATDDHAAAYEAATRAWRTAEAMVRHAADRRGAAVQGLTDELGSLAKAGDRLGITKARAQQLTNRGKAASRAEQAGRVLALVELTDATGKGDNVVESAYDKVAPRPKPMLAPLLARHHEHLAKMGAGGHPQHGALAELTGEWLAALHEAGGPPDKLTEVQQAAFGLGYWDGRKTLRDLGI